MQPGAIQRLREGGRARLCAAWPGALAACFLAASCASPPDLPGQGIDAGKTLVYRDTWGVAHVYAPDVERGLFAQGWAQAEDRPYQLLRNLLMGIGELASVAGPGAVDVD
ncbi:MAG: penicillin acylase family protein, partial [Thermoanaerobaculia bacterium]|nr:penicillin acylase family protein [Thermoanaerobaculia bacterium]